MDFDCVGVDDTSTLVVILYRLPEEGRKVIEDSRDERKGQEKKAENV